ncbi:MAG TPA: helix-turn-helix domain-containing protein [Candidatus Limnocylindria bacterium]|nr:helix-turn-helix domain-containing protein [Candidatus Limnocylindria bacterium]
MTSVVDLWRAIDPEARLASGSSRALSRPVRAIQRTRTAPPHLPEPADGAVLVVDQASLRVASVPELISWLRGAQLSPVAVILAGFDRRAGPEPADDQLPVLVSARPAMWVAADALAYLADEPAALERRLAELRLACAEAALAEPELTTPAGLIAARIGRGVAISLDGDLKALHPRPAGRALAARFAAVHARLLAPTGQGRREVSRQEREGLFLVERAIRPGAAVWLFDDLPLAAADEVAADALAVTARALLRRPPPEPATPRPSAAAGPGASGPAPPASNDPLDATLLAVARSNGRVAPAARLLGVHRNTVLYRLRRALEERGLDPRRPQDALRILAAADPADARKMERKPN